MVGRGRTEMSWLLNPAEGAVVAYFRPGKNESRIMALVKKEE